MTETKMKRPITVLGSGRPTNSSPNSNVGIVYAFIPLVLGVPIVAYVMAQTFHMHLEQFTPLLFIFSGLGLAAVFALAAKMQRETRHAVRKNKPSKIKEISKDL
jgi:uncharacterized membrane protein